VGVRVHRIRDRHSSSRSLRDIIPLHCQEKWVVAIVVEAETVNERSRKLCALALA
jgi:hypothetical protein